MPWQPLKRTLTHADGRRPLFLRHDNHCGRISGVSGEAWRLSAQSVWAIVSNRSLQVTGKALTPSDFREAFRIRMIREGASAPIVDVLLGSSKSAIHDDDQVARIRQDFERYGPAAVRLPAVLCLRWGPAPTPPAQPELSRAPFSSSCLPPSQNCHAWQFFSIGNTSTRVGIYVL